MTRAEGQPHGEEPRLSRTTINIPRVLKAEAEQVAEETGTNFTTLVTEGLIAILAIKEAIDSGEEPSFVRRTPEGEREITERTIPSSLIFQMTRKARRPQE